MSIVDDTRTIHWSPDTPIYVKDFLNLMNELQEKRTSMAQNMHTLQTENSSRTLDKLVDDFDQLNTLLNTNLQDMIDGANDILNAFNAAHALDSGV